MRYLPHLQMKLKTQGRCYEHIYKRHILPVLGQKRLRDVRMETIQDLIYAGQNKYSPQTLLHVRNALSGLFRLAKKIQWFRGELPTEGVELPPMRRKEKRALTPDQAQSLLAALPQVVCDLCDFLLGTGLRIGEALGLRWRLVNLFPDWQLIDGKEVPPYSMVTGSKTEAGNRIVPFSQPVLELLQRIHAGSKFTAPDDPVFVNSRGGPMDAHNAAFRTLKPIANNLGLGWVSWHALRHTANTWGRMRGMSAMARQKAFGWSADRMALHYDHATVEEVRQGMERISEMLHPAKASPAIAMVQ